MKSEKTTIAAQKKKTFSGQRVQSRKCTLGRSLLTVVLLFFTLHSSLFILTSCGDIENEYSNHAAYLRFDNSSHLDQTIGAALTGVTSNIFCRIYVSRPSQLNFQNNQGASSSVTLTAREMQSPLALGINNETGIIVGYGFGGTLYCYDACCANCYDNGKTLHLLSINSAGIATCSKCNRQYDLTNNGLSPQGGRLERYHATASGQPVVLIVNNHYY